MRRRVGSIGAIVLVVCGLLIAVGEAAVVLALLAVSAVALAFTAVATLAHDRGWARSLRSRLRRCGAVARAAAGAGRAECVRLVRRSRLANELTTLEQPLWPVRREISEVVAGDEQVDAAPPLAGAPAGSRPREVVSSPTDGGAGVLRAIARWIGGQARDAGLRPEQTGLLSVQAGLADRLAHNRNALGAQLRRLGEPAQAAEQHRTAKALYAAAGDLRGEALATHGLALALASTGDESAALGAFEQARALLRVLGDDEHEAQVLANIGVAKRRAGAADEAVRLFEAALAKLDPETPAYRLVERQLRRAS